MSTNAAWVAYRDCDISDGSVRRYYLRRTFSGAVSETKDLSDAAQFVSKEAALTARHAAFPYMPGIRIGAVSLVDAPPQAPTGPTQGSD